MSDLLSNSMQTTGSTLAGQGAGNDPASLAASNPASVNMAPQSNPSSPSATAATIGQSGSFSAAEVAALRAHYDSRISDLQRSAHKAENERNKALVDQAELQKQLTSYQEQATTNLSSAADAAQQAIQQANQLRVRVEQLEGELRTYKALEAHPHLSPFREFLPKQGPEEELNAAIQKLNQIREQDLQRLGQGQQPYLAQSAQGQLPNAQTPPVTNPNQVNPALNPFQALYGNRPNVSPLATMPGSTPAAMSPVGSGNTQTSINQMLQDALGDPAKFEAALERAKALLPQAINEQLGS